MSWIARSPPVVGLASSALAGAALHFLNASLPWALPLFLVPLLPKRTSKGPSFRWFALILSMATGFLVTGAWALSTKGDCRYRLEDGGVVADSGWLLGPLVDGRGEFRPREGLGSDDCREVLRLVVPGHRSREFPPGTLLQIHGTWRAGRGGDGRSPILAGYLRVDSLYSLPNQTASGLRARRAQLSGWIQRRLVELFPDQGSLAVALVWARKDGLSQEVRESFARAGVAHLLAISGFHVGVVAGVLFTLSGPLALSYSTRSILSSLGVWAYVFSIGLPDAALRVAILLSLFSLGRLWGRFIMPQGALASAFVGFLLLDPGALLRPGFQLSFLGALGLVLAYRPLSQAVSDLSRGRAPRWFCQGLAAGTAATLATLPLVAWHFGRISVIGIPATLMGAPLVALAIPGIFACLVLSPFLPGVADFLASGVEVVLGLFSALVVWAGEIPFASAWVSEGAILGGGVGLAIGVGYLALRRWWGGNRRSRGWNRVFLFAFMGAGGVMMGPSVCRLADLGSIEMVFLDVGQGDATLLRSPAGRWILVDAGPRTPSFDAGERVILPYLRRHGVKAIEVMVLTHPDMDHVGGAGSILGTFPTRLVLDPGEPTGTDVFLDALTVADNEGVPWRIISAGDSLNLDGMVLRVVAPEDRAGEARGDGSNEVSVVMELRFGEFSALLTGDAPVDSEKRFVRRLLSPGFQVLKVGHHGSTTSTSTELLKETEPETAVISVGRRNRFGHPRQEVLTRLEDFGVQVFRTDSSGPVVVKAQQDGSYSVSFSSGA